MARSYETALAELENKKGELEALSTIGEEEVCYIYNVDSKSEIVKILSNEIEVLEREVEYLTPLDWSNDPAIEIFSSYEAMKLIFILTHITHMIMKTSNFRHKVFCMAYELMRATGKAFAVCLSRAWALYRLTKQMHKGIVSFAYEKSDGSLRKAKGTLKDIQNLIKGTGSENYKTVRYFDIEANGFRSFKVENFITIY